MKSPGVSARPGVRPNGGGRAELLALVAACVFLAAAAGYVTLTKSLWLDEAYSLNTASRSLAGAWRQTVRFELQPPGYFLALWLWLNLGTTVEVARLLSVIAALALLVVLYRTQRLLDLRWPISLPLLAAVTPSVLWAASEARPYALAMLFVAVSTHWFLRLWIIEPDGAAGRLALVWYVASSYLAVLTFYYTGFVLAAQFIAGLLRGNRRGQMVRTVATLALLLIPWAPVVLGQTGEHPNYNPPILAADEGFWPQVAAFGAWLRAYLADVFLNGVPVAATPVGLVTALSAAVGLGAARTWFAARPWSRVDTALLITGVGSFMLLLALRIANVVLVGVRHPRVVLPGFLVFGAVFLGGIGLSRRIRAVAVVVVAGGLSVTALSYLRNASGSVDWRAATMWVERVGAPREPVFFFPADNVLMFDYYAAAEHPRIGLPHDLSLQRYTLGTRRITDEGVVSRRIADRVPPGGTFWLLETRGWFDSEYLGGAILQQVVAERLEVVGVKEFGSLRIHHLKLPETP